MSLLTRFLPNVLNTQLRSGGQALSLVPGTLPLNTFVRTIVRNHFPRPSERKRVKRHGWAARMATPEGRRVLMNRILKGRYVYSH